MATVNFYYRTGLLGEIFRNVRLMGSWNGNGCYSDEWITIAMRQENAADGSQSFNATVNLDDSQIGSNFKWSVMLDGPGGANQAGITTEINDRNSMACHREFRLSGGSQTEEYDLTHCRKLGANKFYQPGRKEPAILFSVWAPNAQNVELVRGNTDSGYIANDGNGITSSPGQFPMAKDEKTDIWYTDLQRSPALQNFRDFDHTPYMYKITKEDGSIAYRTDLYSRCQIGRGKNDPQKTGEWNGTRQDLNGVVSCSVVVDPELVTQDLDEPFPQKKWLTVNEFWQNEFNPLRVIPTRLEDYVIYELHVGGLGANKKDDQGRSVPGNLRDALQMLDYLVDLGINAVELMPMNEFEGWASWGYGSSHFMAIEYAGGGRDEFKHFVRECHRRGIAVILDVVYNHYSPGAERAQWMYDTNQHENNSYYWYEGRSSDYSDPQGGYIDNVSTGFGPRFWEENVRKMFMSSAAALIHEFHLDGFRVDQTTSIHAYPVLHADGRPVADACIFGAKFLREFTRTLRLTKPSIVLIAEDHSNWAAVTQPTVAGGLGFDAIWYADFYHHLIGDSDRGPEYAKLIRTAGLGDNRPLAIDYFAGVFNATGDHTVVYSESHDEAGNAQLSGRTMQVAVNRAPLVGETRDYAESRCRVASGLTFLSAGIPMFFMGEEVGFQKDYHFDTFMDDRENFAEDKAGNGQYLFRYYQDVIRLRKEHDALHSPNKDVVYTHNDNRVIAFRRWYGQEDFLVIASLNDHSFADGYVINSPRIPDGQWQEAFNSDSVYYNGNNVGNAGQMIQSNNGYLNVVVPANGMVVLQKV
jgi:1,4-alpha-glucan branching enzyme